MNTSGVPNAPNPGTSRTFQFDLNDVCCLKSNPSLTGIVLRTYLDVYPLGPPEDDLMVSYTSVPQDVLTEYLQTGVPRKGYVIVQFKWVSQGCSLIHEDDLELLDRCINFGSYVKRPDDTMCGTVIGASATCTLEPIAYRNYDESLGEYGSVEFNERLMPHSRRRPGTDSSRPLPIHDVPLSEIMHHEPFINDDLIIYHQKLGIIRQVDRDAILRVSNVPVSLVDPKDLEVPCHFDDNELIWMPKGQPCRVVDTNLRYMEHDSVIPGQYVCTKYKNMRGINGGTVPKEDPRSFAHGHVLSTPATEYKVEWLCTNVFGLGTCEIPNGIETLRASVFERDAVICDFENLSAGGTVKSATSLQIGDMIRFRDPKSAFQKYSYQHIPPEETFGYDMNMFHITSRKTALTVRWLDGNVTTEDIKCLRWDPGLDENIWPGSIVVLKDGIETMHWPGLESTSAYIRQLPSHRKHRESKIRARTVGVVQAVNIRERIVTVRWYKDPYLILLHGGQILASLYSKLGELGDTISQVSLYELDVFPCLERSHGDIVLLAPDTIHTSVLTEGSLSAYNIAGPCTFSYTSSLSLSQMHSYLKDMSLAMFHWEWFKSMTTVDTSPLPPRHSHHYQRKLSERSTADFVGQIIAIDVNGEITVRLAGTCRDVRVPFERIMMVMDGGFTTPLGVPAPGDLSTMSMNSAYTYKEEGPGVGDEEGLLHFDDEEGLSSDDDEDMSETTLREALRRYVNDEDGILLEEEEWVSGNDEEEEEEAISGSDVEDMSEIKCAVYRYVNSSSADDGYSEDADMKTENDSDFDMRDASDGVVDQSEEMTSPPGFLILEGPPPSDHHFISKDGAGGSALRVKRIQKECDILDESLPPGIFVRAWESRMDLLRVLFIGPEGTPYQYAPILIDFHFPGDFPRKPPEAFFHSWIGGQGRINPNLYEDGKICLSILGTWPTQNQEEMWSATKSTVLQILVSIMGLVLVQSPFYNEAGYEVFAAEGGRRVESDKYTEKTFLTTRRYIKYALDHQVSGMEDIVDWNYLPSRLNSEDCSRPLLLRRAIDTALAMIEHEGHTSSGEERSASAFVSRLSLGAVVMLRKYITELEALEVAATA
ncbi:ubiquitin-conjugating enzyme E2 [Aspergillus tubingensis]|uniref:ubiquitin-conjugating enzyme E2 n=1 Tax=Aspergillus tubingensis TaxID=5068 RepID=UPI001578CA38|nr:ubiquitin conjugating enzyme [Aspergillus tubingensis]GFN14691.1 ubiquitin conjugating enzyme [Aspergillus tubingensis]